MRDYACGPDIYVACLLAAAELMLHARDAWNRTLILVFQPDEERAGGAQRMVDDGLYERIPILDILPG